jgi:hypothetical protein
MDDVGSATDRRAVESEADAVAASVDLGVAGDEVPTPLFDRDAQHPVVAGAADEHADGEAADRAVTHGDPVMTDAEDPEVAELVVGAVRELGAVAVDHVAVEVEGDIVGADHDAVR